MVHVYFYFIYMFIHNLFLFCKAHFRVYLSYILSCILTVGILIIILLIMCKCLNVCNAPLNGQNGQIYGA